MEENEPITLIVLKVFKAALKGVLCVLCKVSDGPLNDPTPGLFFISVSAGIGQNRIPRDPRLKLLHQHTLCCTLAGTFLPAAKPTLSSP